MRTLSLTAKRALMGEETGEVFLPLLTISNVGLSQPIRLVADTQDLVSRGQTYLACPFTIALPDDREDQLGRVTLSVDNVDRNLVLAVRTITQPPTIRLEVVLASSPDVVEAGPFTFALRDVTYDALTVSGTLMFEDILNESFPQHHFQPSTTPGLF